MLSIILLILKIIGITLLIILGILLLLIAVVLFVPVRYRVKVEHGDAFVLDGCVSWLFHLVHARIDQTGKNRRIWIRILGFLIYDSERPVKKSVKKERMTIKRSDDKSGADIIDDEIPEAEEDKPDIKHPEKTAEKIKEEKADIKNEAEVNDIDRAIDNENKDNDGFLLRKYKKVKNRIKDFFQRIKRKLMNFIQKLLNIKHKISLILDFMRDDINREGFRHTYNSIKNLLKHILPRKIKSRLIFGTGDPCSTGQLLGVLGILYGIYGDNLQITPDFENKICIGSHYAKGRIRIWTILIIVIKLLLDKRFKELKMNYQLLKEAL